MGRNLRWMYRGVGSISGCTMILYPSETMDETYTADLDGLQAVVESRAARAYYAVRRAQGTRENRVAVHLNDPREKLKVSMRRCGPDYTEVHRLLTGQEPTDSLSIDDGSALAAEYLPAHPEHCASLRDAGTEYRALGEMFCREIGYARDCGYFDQYPGSDLYWDTGVALIGNGDALAAAVSVSFEATMYDLAAKRAESHAEVNSQ